MTFALMHGLIARGDGRFGLSEARRASDWLSGSTERAYKLCPGSELQFGSPLLLTADSRPLRSRRHDFARRHGPVARQVAVSDDQVGPQAE
jgi:hypothetical protein